MQPLINLALANKEEQEKFKRNTVDITQSLVGVGVTGMAAFYTFQQQNKQSNLLKSISGIGNSLKQKQTDSDSVKTISREIKELVLSKQKEKLEAKTRNQVSVMSLLSDSSKSVDDKYNELLKLGKNERVAHLSTMMSMVNDPNLGIEDLKKQQLTINLKNSIQLEGQNLELKEQQAIKQVLSNFGLHTSVDTQDKYTSLYQYNLNLSKNNLISSVVDENGNASTMRSNLSNTYDNINKASGEIGKVNEHIFKTFNNINDNALFDSIEKDPGVGSGNRSTVEQTIKARYNRISKILKNAPGFDIEIVGVQEKDQGVSAYARLTRKSGVGQSIEPIVMPLYLSNKGQFGRESKYARMNSSLSSTSLAPSYVLDLNDVKNIIEDQTLNQQAKKRAIQDLMKSNQYEDALINILEKTYDNGTLKNIDQHGRNELMEVMRGFTSDINQSMSGEKSKGWFTSTKQKSTSQINSNKIHFTFDPTKTTNKDIEQLIPKLAELQLGFQGLSGSGAGIKKYSVNNKEIGVRMAYAAENAAGNQTITPYNILRPLGVSNEMITPGASRPGQLFDKNEAFLGFVGKGQNVEGNVSATFGFNNDIKVVAQKGKDLLNVGTQSLGKDLDIVAANTPVIIHFDEMAKKGQAIGLADAMSYAGGEMVVAKSLKKNINYSEGMKELAIYQSDEFKKLLTGEVLELEGDALTNFFNKFSDDQGRLIIGESDIGPEFIHRTSAMRKLRLQIAKNVDKGNAKQLQLIGEAIGVEQGSKIFSEVIKGTQYGVQNVLSETSFQEVISKAGGEGDFLQLAKTKFGLTNTTNLLLTGQDVVTKAPSYLASYMFGGLRGLGFTEDQLHKDIFDKNKYTGDIIDPTDTTAVKQYQTKYLQQTAKNILGFMLDQKLDPRMAGQITEETIGAVLTSSQKLDVYKSKKEDAGFLQQLLDSADIQTKLTAAGLDKDKIIKRANTGFGFGYVSTFAGTPSSEYKDKLARIEPRVATYLMGSLKTLFGLKDKEIGNFLGRMIGDVEGAADKINLMPTLIMQAKGFSINESPAAYDADIEQMLKTGKLFNASKEFAVAFMNANMENNPDALVRFFESSTYKAGIIGEQDAFGAVFDIEDMFRNADDTIDEEGLRLLRSKIGNKSQIVLPMQKALEIVSGIELKREEGDMKIQGQYYRQLNDAMHALSTSKNVTNIEAKEKLITGALESMGSMSETSGKIMRNLFSGRIKGSATIEGKGIRLGDLRPTRLHDDAGINKRVSQKLNKAFSASMGYTVFMDTQAFMNTISSMTDEEKLIQTKKFMLGMEEVGFDVDKATGQLTQKAAKDVAPEGIKASVFRNPFLGPTHMAVMTNIFRFDSEFLESHKEFGNVLASNQESSGFRSLNILEQMLGSKEFESATVNAGGSLDSIKNMPGGALTFRDISLVYKAMEANPELFKDVKLTSQSIQERIDKKDKSIGNLETKLRDLESLKNPQRTIELYNTREVELAKKEFYQKSNEDAINQLNLQKSELQKEIDDLNKLTPEQRELKTIKKSSGAPNTKVRHKYLKDFIDRIEKQGDKSKFIQDKLMNDRLRKEFGLYIKHQSELKGIDNNLVLDYTKSSDTNADKKAYNEAFVKFKNDYLTNPDKYNNAYNQLQDKLYEQNKKNLFGGLDSSNQPITKPAADVSKERLELSVHKRLIQNQAKYVEKKLANQKEQISKLNNIFNIKNPTSADISKGVKDFKIGFLKSIDLLKISSGTINYDEMAQRVTGDALGKEAIEKEIKLFLGDLQNPKTANAATKFLFKGGVPEKEFGFEVPKDFKNLLFDKDGKLINLPKDFDINDTETVKRFFTGKDSTTLKEIINGLNNFEDPNDQNKKLNYSRNKRNYKLGLRDMTIGDFETSMKSNHAQIKSELTEQMEEILGTKKFQDLLTKEHLDELNNLKGDQKLIQFSEFLNNNLYKTVNQQKNQKQIDIFSGLVGNEEFNSKNTYSYYQAIQVAKENFYTTPDELKNIKSENQIDENIFDKLKELQKSIDSRDFDKTRSIVGEKSLLLHAVEEQLNQNLINDPNNNYFFRGIADFAIASEQQLFMMNKQTEVLETNKKFVFEKEQARQQRLIIDYEKTKSTYGLEESKLTFDIPELLKQQKATEGFNTDLAGIRKPKDQIKTLSQNIDVDYVLKGIHADVINEARKSLNLNRRTPTDPSHLPKILNYLNDQMSKAFSSATKTALSIDIGKTLLQDSNDQFSNFAKAEIEAVKNDLNDKDATKKLRNKAKEFKKTIITKDLNELKRFKQLSEIKNEKVRLRSLQFLEFKDKFEGEVSEQTGKKNIRTQSHIQLIDDFLNKASKNKATEQEANELFDKLTESKSKQLSQNLNSLKRYTDNKNIVDSFLSNKFLNESSLVLSQEQSANAEIYAAKKTLSERAKKQEKFDRFNRANNLIKELESTQAKLTDDKISEKKKARLEKQIERQKTAIELELYDINNKQATPKQQKELQTKYEKQYENRVTNKISSFEYREPEVDSTGKVVIDTNTDKPKLSTTPHKFNSLDEIKAFRDQLIQQDIDAEIKKKTDKIAKIDAKITKKQEAIDKNKIKIGEVQAKIDLLKEQIGFGSSPKAEVEITDHLNQKYTVPTVHTQVFGESSTQELKTSDVEKIVGYKYEQPDQDLADKINYKYLQSNSKTHPEFTALDTKYSAVDLSSIPDLEELHKNEKEFKGAKDFDYNQHRMTPNKQLFKTDLQEKGSVRQLVLTQDQIDAAKTSTEKGTVGAKIISAQDKIKKLEAQKQKLEAKVAGGADATKKMEISLQEALDTALGEYTSSYSKVVGSGSGQIVFPEFESEFSFKDLKGNDINNFGIKVRTDLSRAMVGDFDADIYQAIIHDDKMVKHFQTQFDPANVGNFQRQGALFTLNMEMIKSGMDQFGKRLNEQTGQILDYKAFRYSEVQKEQILKGTVGAVDTTAKSAMIASMYSMMESKDDLAKMRKTHLAAQSLISAAQEIVVIKSKSLEQATDVGKRYKESIDEAFKTGNTQKFRDFLTQDLFKGTKFEEGFEVSKVITKDMPADLSDAYQKTLMKEPIRFDINSIMEGFENIVSTTRKMGLDKLASDKMFANVMASNRTIDSDVFNNLVNRMGLLESAVTSEQLDDDQFSRLFNQISGLEGNNQVDNLMNSRAVKDVFSSLSNTRLAAATTAALGASYLLSADYSKETLSLDETFSDNRVNEKIAQKNLYEGYNRDAAIPSDAMQRPFYKDMVSRVQSPGETYIAKQQSFLMKGQVNSLQDAQYLNNMVLSNGGSSSMMINDNRMPLTGNYIDKMMGE